MLHKWQAYRKFENSYALLILDVTYQPTLVYIYDKSKSLVYKILLIVFYSFTSIGIALGVSFASRTE